MMIIPRRRVAPKRSGGILEQRMGEEKQEG
jgi:hypothetical protein